MTGELPTLGAEERAIGENMVKAYMALETLASGLDASPESYQTSQLQVMLEVADTLVKYAGPEPDDNLRLITDKAEIIGRELDRRRQSISRAAAA